MKEASASQVREWLASNGGVGARGRIKAADAERFNKAHSKNKVRYTPESDAEKRHTDIEGVVMLDSAGRKVTKTLSITTDRARALIGSAPKTRGRLPKTLVAGLLSAEFADTVADQFV